MVSETAEAPVTTAPPEPTPAVPPATFAPEAGLPSNPEVQGADLPQVQPRDTQTQESLREQVQAGDDQARVDVVKQQVQSGGGTNTGELPNTGGGFLGGIFQKLNPFK